MITKNQVNFSSYKQKLTYHKQRPVIQYLIHVLRRLKLSTTAYKLDFYERMINFMKIVGLGALSNNMKMVQSITNIENIPNETESFIEFLFHFGILEKQLNNLYISPKYFSLLDKNIIGKVIDEDISKISTLRKGERKMVRDYYFITDLIKKYDHEEFPFQHILKNRKKWEALVKDKKLDYEIRLCETLRNLVHFKASHKIKSPFHDDYYTESGQSAFQNFTRFAFPDYMKNIALEKQNIHAFDLGCGYGNYIEEMHKTFPDARITGIEMNPEVYIKTKEKFKGTDKINILNGNFFEYKTTEKYDLIFMNYVLFYFDAEEKRKLFKKIGNLLSNSGSVVICQYISGIENLKTKLAKIQQEYSLSKKIEMFYSEKILYANTLWNDAVDTFSESVKWNDFLHLTEESGLYIRSMVNADRYYYSLFIELKKKQDG